MSNSLPDRDPCRWTTGWRFACFGGFAALLLIAGLQVLGQGLTWDSLHLLRPYDSGELLAAWSGPWDPDGIERPSYRPLLPLFFTLLHGVFGEQPLLQRCFVVGLTSLSLLMLVEAGRHYVRRWTIPAVGIVLLLLSNATSVYVGWLTEAFRPLQLFWFAGCLLLLHHGLRRKSLPLLSLALFAHALGLLTREENLPLVLIPVVLCLSRRALPIAGLFFVQVPIYVLLRRAFIEEALPGLSDFLRGPPELLLATLNSYPLTGLPVLLAVAVGLFLTRGRERLPIWLALAMVPLACLPGAAMVRIDLVLFPALFLCFAAAFGLEPLLASKRIAPRAVAIAVVAALAVFGVAGSWKRVIQLDDLALSKIVWNLEMLDGRYADRATIPDERRQALVARYRELGLGDDYRTWILSIGREAREAGHFSNDGSGRPFVSRTYFLGVDSLSYPLLE
jgi:hypothetical protein